MLGVNRASRHVAIYARGLFIFVRIMGYRTGYAWARRGRFARRPRGGFRRAYIRRAVAHVRSPRPLTTRGLAQRSVRPRIYTFTNSWDGGIMSVSGTTDTLWTTEFTVGNAGFATLLDSFGQYRVEEATVMILPSVSVFPYGTLTGGTAGATAPFVVSSCIAGPIPSMGGTVMEIMNQDDALVTPAGRRHVRTWNPVPSAEAYNTFATSGYFVPGGAGARSRAPWVSTAYGELPHGTVTFGIKAPGGSSAPQSSYRVLYTLRVSFRRFAGDLTINPVTGVTERRSSAARAAGPTPGPSPTRALPVAPEMVHVTPVGAWTPGAAATARTGLGWHGDVPAPMGMVAEEGAEADSALSSLAEQVGAAVLAGAAVRRTDSVLDASRVRAATASRAATRS